MKKIVYLVFLLSLLTGCQSVQETLTLKKKDKADEFLIEKKNPLVLPPNFDELPLPKNDQILNDAPEEETLEIFSKIKNSSDENESRNSSIEKFILENIGKNETNK